jgi:radical SAM-linked protein
MILLKYSKLNGAEFIPHLDTLRHFTKTVRRMDIPINYSQGFNPHVLLYLSSPIALGLKSESEYCLFDTPYDGDDFLELFNACSPKGIRGKEVYKVNKKVNVAGDITSALYEIKGLNVFDVREVLSNAEFSVFDNRAGQEKIVRDRIKNLRFEGGVLYAELMFGNVTLRPDYLVNKLLSVYGGDHPTVLKKEVFFLGGLTVKEYLAQNNVVEG